MRDAEGILCFFAFHDFILFLERGRRSVFLGEGAGDELPAPIGCGSGVTGWIPLQL